MRTLDYSLITRNLYVGKTPRSTDYKSLKGLGVELVINVRVEKPTLPYRRKQIREIWVPTLDSRYAPLRKKRLLEVAENARAVMNQGGGVYIYCRQGRHRSVLLAALVLLAQGKEEETVRQLILKNRKIADDRAIRVAMSIYKDSHL